MTPPYLVLHREEFTQPRVSPRALAGSYPAVSPITRNRLPKEDGPLAGLFSVALVVTHATNQPEGRLKFARAPGR